MSEAMMVQVDVVKEAAANEGMNVIPNWHTSEKRPASITPSLKFFACDRTGEVYVVDRLGILHCYNPMSDNWRVDATGVKWSVTRSGERYAEFPKPGSCIFNLLKPVDSSVVFGTPVTYHGL